MNTGLLFYKFKINNDESFNDLRQLFYKLKTTKEVKQLHADDALQWKASFKDEQLVKFWNPSQKELDEYWKLYYSLPLELRNTDSRLQVPWDLESWLDAIANAEYDLIRCERISEDIGRIEYEALAFPYGSADALRFFIGLFDCTILEEETGYLK